MCHCCCNHRPKYPEDVLRETPLQEVFAEMSPTPQEYKHADQWMSQFLTDAKNDLATNALELDKHIINIAGGGLIVMVTFLGVVEFNNLSHLTLKYLGFAAIWILTGSILAVVFSYIAAVRLGVLVAAISEANNKLIAFVNNSKEKNEEFWIAANAKKNRYCDLVTAGRRWNSIVGFARIVYIPTFVVGILLLAAFLTYNLSQLTV